MEEYAYVIIRNYKRCEISKRIPLGNNFPTCINIIDFTKIPLDESAFIVCEGMNKAKGTLMLTVGSSNGKILIYRVGPTQSQNYDRLLETKSGLAFGGIAALDLSGKAKELIALTDSGEIIVYDLQKKLNEE